MRNQIVSVIVLLSATLGVGAQQPVLQKTSPIEKQLPVRTGTKTVSSRTLAKGITEKVFELPTGVKIKTVTGIPDHNLILNPEAKGLKKTSKMEAPREGYVIYEDFEGWDGITPGWMPEGWTVDHRDSPESDRGWKMTKPELVFDFIKSKCATYELFGEEPVDEWLVTPEFAVTSGMELCWSAMTSPYFYDWSYFNDKTYQLDKFEIINDLKVNVSIDGGATWETIYNHAEELIKETKGNFFAMFDYTVRPFTASLEKYAGKTVKVGFQVTGTEGNTTFIDDVSVGLPETGTSYVRQLSNLYMGLSKYDENVPASIMVGPVYSPVKYSNTTKTKNAEFTWTYTDSSGEEKTSNEKNLEVTYTTDYTSAATTRNNMYRFPVLKGSSASTAPDEFTFPGFYQAGGKGEYERHYVDTDEYEIVDLGLTVIDPVTEGSATYADIAVPYFGYNQESDNFWGGYVYGEDWPSLANDSWAHLERYADFFYTPDTPIVIEGVRTNAYGKISRNTKLVAEIYFLNGGMQIKEKPDYTAVCTGDDITIIDRYSSSDILSFDFKFDEPIVVSKSKVPYFVVAIGGFRDAENVDYFSPELSAYNNPNGLGLGWLGLERQYMGVQSPLSWSPVSNLTGDELVSFYIMLDATFPWLEGEDTEVNFDEISTANIALDSYYPAERLKLEGVPEWIEASLSGRYGATNLTLTAVNVPEGEQSGEVKVTGPGVSKTIKVRATGNSSLNEVSADIADGATVYYTLDGKRADSANLRPGFYIKKEGSKASKIIVR